MRSNTLAVLFATFALLVSCSSFSDSHIHPPKVPETESWLFDSITFEIAPVTSCSPDPRALDLFRNRLVQNNICRRSAISFQIRSTAAGPPPGLPWTTGMLQNYESLRRSLQDDDPEDRDLNVFVTYADGIFMDFDGIKILGGIQYSDSAFAVFKAGAGDRQASVLLHEFGHMIGIGKSSNRPNVDPAHRFHCLIPTCALYYSAPGTNADFDLYCKRELERLIRSRNGD